jgi:selenocysteine lyase/cysteine desulfurase
MGLERKGEDLRLFQPVDGRIDIAGLLRMCDSRTRVVAVSWVQFANGFRADLPALASELRSKDTFLIVDAMQAVGHLATDLARLPVDLLAAAAPKWMLGPLGIGFAYVSDRLFPRLWPPSLGVESVVQDHEYFQYELCLKPDARRFEDSGPNLPGLSGLNAAAELLLQAGPEEIEGRVLQLADSLREGLRHRDCRLLLEPAPQERSGIVSFLHRSQPAAAVHARLREAGVITSVRGDFVRASPHFYNNQDDLGRLLEALPV